MHTPQTTHPFAPGDPPLFPSDTANGVARLWPDGFELLDEVGRGGMGIVYRARDLSLRRDVAVKVLREGTPAHGPLARRFRDEATITGQLQHPGIPSIHRVGTLPDGRPFLVMKLIAGRTLYDLVEDRPDQPAELGRFLAVFEAVAQAVAYAHSRGVVHRDLKPGNVMVGEFGEVQVLDWGIAKVLPADPDAVSGGEPDDSPAIDAPRDDSLTEAGSAVGTPAYMPPEQARGELHRINRRSDVFGLGAILCKILTGEPPYAGTTAESSRHLAARGEIGDAFTRLDACGAEPQLVTLAKRCLASDPDARPADAGEVAQAVADLRADAERRARQTELDRTRVEVRAGEKRKRWLVRVAALVVLLGAAALAAGFAHWAVSLYQTAEQLKDADAEARTAQDRVRVLEAERDHWEGDYQRLTAEHVRRQHEQAREAFFPDGPTPGPSEDFTRGQIELAWPAADSPLLANEGSGSATIADRQRFAARLHLSLGEASRAEGLLLAALSHHLHLAIVNENDPERLLRVAEGYRELHEAVRLVKRNSDFPWNSLAEAVKWYDKAIAATTTATTGDPTDDRVSRSRQVLREARAGKAKALATQGRHAEAVREWDAIQLPPWPTERHANRKPRALCLVHADPARARAEAEAWLAAVAAEEAERPTPFRTGKELEVPGLDGGPSEIIPDDKDDTPPTWRDRVLRADRIERRCELLHDAASVFAALSARSPEPSRDPLADRAAALLRDLHDRGYFRRPGRIAELDRDAALDPLRRRADFQRLRAAPWPPVAPAPRPVQP